MIEDITPLILTYNEAPNIARTLDKLKWARRIVVIDSGSTDETVDLVRSYPRTEIFERRFDDCASQWNFGNSCIADGWILSLDADYELSDDLVSELPYLRPGGATQGYRARFVYRIFGRSLRGSLYPPRIVLYQKGAPYYTNEGHTQQLVVNGAVESLNGVIYHDDRKPLGRWFSSQIRYAHGEAEYLLKSERTSLSRIDRVRLAAWPAPFAVVVYALIVKGCLFDGWPGWYYVLQRFLAESMIALEIIDRRLRQKS